jgi:hypothetical protein
LSTRAASELCAALLAGPFVLACLAGAGHAATFYVGQTALAADNNPGTQERPLRTLQSGVNRLSPGDRLVIHSGTYHETVMIQRSGSAEAPIEITAAPGEKVVITGADPVQPPRWQLSSRPSVWMLTPWTYTSRPEIHPEGERFRLIGRSEQVTVDGQLLKQVLSEDDMRPGTFVADGAVTHRLLVWLPNSDSARQHTIFTSVRPLLMRISGSYVIVRNLNFELASNLAQQGAMLIAGSHNLVENCIVERTNGVGIDLSGQNNTARKLTSRLNGQLGMAGHGRLNTVDGCILDSNNVKGFPWGWEAGGIKIAGTRFFRVINCVARHNNGPGFWFDIDNREGTIERSYAADNVGPGIIVEISAGIRVHNNVCLRNGLPRARGDWADAGILIAESDRCTVTNNVCAGNRNGIVVRYVNVRTIPANPAQDRPAPVSFYLDGLVLERNILSNNKDYQLAFYANQRLPAPEMARVKAAVADWRVNHNLYWEEAGEHAIVWDGTWSMHHDEFNNVESFELRFPQYGGGSVMAKPGFLDPSMPGKVSTASPARRIGAGLTEAGSIP